MELFLQVIRKRNHPAVLHSDLCFNEVGQMNDGPECRCSWAAKRSGVRHNKYAGEAIISKCEPLARLTILVQVLLYGCILLEL